MKLGIQDLTFFFPWIQIHRGCFLSLCTSFLIESATVCKKLTPRSCFLRKLSKQLFLQFPCWHSSNSLMSKHKLTSVYIAHITWERQFQIYSSQDLDIFAERADGLGFKDKSNSPQNWIAGVANKEHLRFYNHTLPGGPAMVPPPLHWHQQTKRDKSVLTVFPDFKHWILGTNL